MILEVRCEKCGEDLMVDLSITTDNSRITLDVRPCSICMEKVRIESKGYGGYCPGHEMGGG